MPEPAGSSRATPAAVVLAAGGSRRFGTPKQLAVVEGEPLVRRTTRICREAGCAPVVVTVGARAEEVTAAVEGLGDPEVRVVEVPTWREGMAASVRIGVAAVPEGRPLLLVPCDLPELEAGVLLRLVEAHRRIGAPRVGCLYDAVVGAPALFAPSERPLLLEISGDRGARELLRSGPVVTVEWQGGARDVDRPTDLPGRGAEAPDESVAGERAFAGTGRPPRDGGEMARPTSVGGIEIELPGGWRDVSEEEEDDAMPYAFASPDRDALLQLSDLIEADEGAGDLAPADLEELLDELADESEAGEPLERGVARHGDDGLIVSASYRARGDFVRTWFVSDRRDVVLATLEATWGEHEETAGAVEQAIGSITFRRR